MAMHQTADLKSLSAKRNRFLDKTSRVAGLTSIKNQPYPFEDWESCMQGRPSLFIQSICTLIKSTLVKGRFSTKPVTTEKVPQPYVAALIAILPAN